MNEVETSRFNRETFLRPFLLKLKVGEIPEGSDMAGYDIRAVHAVADLVEQGIVEGQLGRDATGCITIVYNLRFTMATEEYLSELDRRTPTAKLFKLSKRVFVWLCAAVGALVFALLGAYLQKKFGLVK